MRNPSPERVLALVLRALQLPVSERAAFVAEQAGDDTGLRSDVLDLIESCDIEVGALSALQSTGLPSGSGPLFDAQPAFQGTSRYAVLRQIGAGGFGIIYEVHDLARDSTVALKTLHNFQGDSLLRFKREFRSLADVAHPNLVQLYELGFEEDRWFFTMELIEGETFLAHIWNRPVPSGPAREAFRPLDSRSGDHEAVVNRTSAAVLQLIEGLGALHQSGHLHRDVKPSNVLVARNGRVVIVDFGLAADFNLAAMHQGLTIAGTPAYMSPEQAAGLPLTPASDFYSVGVMLYEALTGKTPYVGSYLDVLTQKQQADPLRPSAVANGVPAHLDDLCIGLLHREPTMRPGFGEIRDRLGAGVADVSRTASRRTPADSGDVFVGRAQPLRALEDAFQHVLDRRPRVAAVCGPSGIGKSALVRRFLNTVRLQHPDAVVITGRCYEQESVPYKALDSLVDGLARYLKGLRPAEVEALLPRDIGALAVLFPVLGGFPTRSHRPAPVADLHETKRRAYAAMRELLGRLGDRSPLVLAVDDLQWGDVESAALLLEILRAPDPPVFLLVASYRDLELATSRFLRAFLTPELTAQSSFSILPLVPLSESESAQLAAALLADRSPSQAVAEAIASESGGSPFFIDELVRFADSGEIRAERAPGTPPPDTDARDASLANMLQIRLSRLAPSALRLLHLVSVNRQPVPEPILRAAADGELSESAVTLLRTEHLLRVRDTHRGVEIEPYHDRIREVVVAGLPGEQLADCHLRLASAFEGDASVDPELLAQHFLGAGIRAKAGHYTLVAAQIADGALAFDRAVRLYRQALSLAEPGDAPHVSLRLGLAAALINAGRGAEGAEQLIDVAKDVPGESLALRTRAAQQFMFAGQLQRGLDIVADVLRALGVSLPQTRWGTLLQLALGRLRVSLRGMTVDEGSTREVTADALLKIDTCWSVAASLSMIDTPRGALIQTRHLLMALRAGDLERVHRALCLEMAFRVAMGGWQARKADALADTLARLTDRVATPYARALYRMSLATRDYLSGHWAAAVAGMDESEQLLTRTCTGVTWEADTARMLGLWALYHTADLTSLRSRLIVLDADARARGDLYLSTSLRGMFFPIDDLVRDDPDAARKHLEEASSGWTQPGFHLQHLWIMYASVEAALYRKDANEAWALVERGWPALRGSTLLMTPILATMMLDVRGRAALALAGQSADRRVVEEMSGVAARCAAQMRRKSLGWATALATLLHAGVRHLAGQPAEVRVRLQQAEVQFARLGMPLWSAITRYRHGQYAGDQAGASMSAAAEHWMREQQIVNPAALAGVHIPWLAAQAEVFSDVASVAKFSPQSAPK